VPKFRWSIRALLILGSAGLVVAAVIAVAAAGTSLLRRLADQEAVARAATAGAAANRILDETLERVRASAQALAWRVGADAERGSSAYLMEAEAVACRTNAHLSGCAIVADEHLLASAGNSIPWLDVVARLHPAARPQVLSLRSGGRLLIVATEGVKPIRNSFGVAVLEIDDAFEEVLARQAGAKVQVLGRAEALEGEGIPGGARELRGRAFDSEAEFAERIAETGAVASVRPLRSADGDVVGLLETELPAANDPVTRRLVRSLWIVSIFVAALAATLGVVLARRLVTPLEELTEAAARIGRGDLATPVPGRDSTEIGTLANSMEEMRAKLQELTNELRRKHAQAEAVVEGIVEGVFAVDRERIVRFVNPQAAQLLGLPQEQILGRFCGDVLRPRTEGRIRPCEESCPILHARFRGSTRAVEHLELPGGARTVVITSAALEAAESTALQFQVIRDETDTEATRRLRDAVLANISHEFRTPLSAQLASIELLRDRLAEIEPKEARELVLALERGALRLTQLIDNLLESVRIESGTDSIRRRPVALDEVIEEATDQTAPLAKLRDQVIEVDLPYPLPAVEGDAPRLVQVFVNLLANATKFAPPGSAIRIGGEVRPREVRVWVEDEGPGLVVAAPPRFERFHRSPGDEPEESGMGLGLFIVKSIVDRHGGRVEVLAGSDTGARPRGTKMCIVLPLSDDGRRA